MFVVIVVISVVLSIHAAGRLNENRNIFDREVTICHVSPREWPWRQRVVKNNMLVYRARNFCVYSRVQKKNPGIDAQMMRFAAFIIRRAE